MSTFDGHVAEFPSIRIDRFLASAEDSTPPLAYFLSHVHADHLIGLESCRKIFVYCSPATRDILLRMEKYPHRMNFAQGILEVRKQTYKRLAPLIKAIPLETPTEIELSPGNSIRVTLFDANHCTGAVMFLIQGGGKTILYSGDVRSEKWWVDSLKRNPILVPYAGGSGGKALRRLDNLYLDTSYVANGVESAHQDFPSKQEGLRELLERVSKYPSDTLFYLDAWTFGYEHVWEALASFLAVRVHLDDYRYKLYTSLLTGPEPKAHEAQTLGGYLCGNHLQKGILTREQSRLHSCEKGHGCQIFDNDFVRITPVVSRYRGKDLVEMGIGGGMGDLDQHLELDLTSPAVLYQLIGYCTTQSKLHPDLAPVINMLEGMLNEKSPTLRLNGTGIAQAEIEGTRNLSSDKTSLEQLLPALVQLSRKHDQQASNIFSNQRPDILRADGLPTRISFPYARHSSYSELCSFVQAFLPVQITPCTVNLVKWHEGRSMAAHFGHLYPSNPIFIHDLTMLDSNRDHVLADKETQSQRESSLASSPPVVRSSPVGTPHTKRKRSPPHRSTRLENELDGSKTNQNSPRKIPNPGNPAMTSLRSTHSVADPNLRDPSHLTVSSTADVSSKPSKEELTNRKVEMKRKKVSREFHLRQQEAYDAALGQNGLDWSRIELVSTRPGPHLSEEEL